ncbi:MAG TPA: hypothetical protein VMU65_15850 [Candidatus Saccharimonadales bacterium]|nr:hypothetical protein [Candidatus Saccharimonadales bacterium]
MSSFTRAALAVGACATTVGLGACGSTTAPASASAAAIGSQPTSAFGTPSSSASTTPNAAASALTLTVQDLPSGGPLLTQISDGEMNSTANTDQRGFANSDNTYRIEDDVLLDTSSQAASADFAQLRDATRSQVTGETSSSPSGIGSQVDEYIGKTSAGYSEIGIVFEEGSVIAVVLIVDSSGMIDPTFAEAVARAQDQRIASAGA